MIAKLLILAASLSAQVQVDEGYEPKVGDRAVVGIHVDRAHSSSKKEYISSANCFSSEEALKLALEAPSIDEQAGLVRTYPDTYHPRPAAAVEVVGFTTIRGTRDGEDGEMRAVRVKILEGEFKGRVFFVRPWNVLRLTERAGGRRGPRQPAPRGADGSKLVLNDLVVESNEFTGMSAIVGRFRNVSGDAMETIQVEIHIEDASGKLISSAPAFCQPNEIGAGEAGSFKTIVKTEPRAASIKVEFRDARRAIPWADKSGKDAHP